MRIKTVGAKDTQQINIMYPDDYYKPLDQQTRPSDAELNERIAEVLGKTNIIYGDVGVRPVGQEIRRTVKMFLWGFPVYVTKEVPKNIVFLSNKDIEDGLIAIMLGTVKRIFKIKL